MTNSSIWLIGSGAMAQDYARVLLALKYPFEVIGRGTNSASIFEQVIGRSVRIGGLNDYIKVNNAPKTAIVAVGVEQLAPITETLIRSGTQRILLEKPGGINSKEVDYIYCLAEEKNVEVLIAYNRRFYHSVQQAREFIARDGGLQSMSFDFTEWSHKISPLSKKPGVKEHWLLANSSHVIDLAFHLSGQPLDWQHWHTGSIDWHPASARFSGAGITDKGVIFSYISDWEAPGRWGIELMTKCHRLILRPMESLQVTQLGSLKVEQIEPENQYDKEFKPGLYQQVKAFLDKDTQLFCSISEQAKNISTYSKIAGYL